MQNLFHIEKITNIFHESFNLLPVLFIVTAVLKSSLQMKNIIQIQQRVKGLQFRIDLNGLMKMHLHHVLIQLGTRTYAKHLVLDQSQPELTWSRALEALKWFRPLMLVSYYQGICLALEVFRKMILQQRNSNSTSERTEKKNKNQDKKPNNNSGNYKGNSIRKIIFFQVPSTTRPRLSRVVKCMVEQ